MAGILTIGWSCTSGADTARTATTPERLSAVAASVLLIASAASSIVSQSSLDAGPASAERRITDRLAGARPARETVLGAYMGAPYTYPSTVKIGKPGPIDFTIDPVHWKGEPFHNPIYYGARVIKWFAGGNTGVMVDFTHSKAIAEPEKEASFSGTIGGEPLPPRAKISDIFKHLEFSHGHNMLTFNGLLRLATFAGRVSPYVGIGGGILLPHTEVTLEKNIDHRTYEYNFAGPVAQALFGIELRFSRMSAFIEYKFSFADYEAPLSNVDGSWLFLDIWRQFHRWLKGEEPPGGHITTQLASHQVIGGFYVRFAPSPAAP